MVWSDAAVQELARKFVPAADEVNVVLWQRGTSERAFFQKLGEQGHYGKAWQGIYLATPSGVFLGSTNQRDAKVVAEMMRKGLEKWDSMDKAARLRSTPPKREAPGLDALYPEGGLVLQVFARDLPRPDGGELKGYWVGAYNSDYAWFTKDEARSLVPASREAGARQPVADKLVRRLVKYHLLDNVRGETRRFEDEHVKRAEMAVSVVRVEGNVVHLSIEGASLAEEQGSEISRGLDARIQGRAAWDTKAEKFTVFEMLAQAVRWGEASVTGARKDDLGRNPMGIALRLAATTEGGDRVPPAHVIWELGAKYFVK